MKYFVLFLSPRWSRFRSWSLLLIPLLMLGCGDNRPKLVPVSGRVTIDGKPLEVGSVQVQPKNHRPAYGALGPDGRFQLTTFDPRDGCVLGEHPVIIAGAIKQINDATGMICAPEKYQAAETSGLQIDIKGPRDDANFELSWKDSGHNGPYPYQIESGRISRGKKTK